MKQSLVLTMKDTYMEWKEYQKEIASATGIPNSYRMILSYIYDNPGKNQKDTAIFCKLTTASISQTVKEMQAKGFLYKEVDPMDQRYFKLYLTEKGTKYAKSILEKSRVAQSMMREAMGPEKEDEMIRFLEELRDVIKNDLPRY